MRPLIFAFDYSRAYEAQAMVLIDSIKRHMPQACMDITTHLDVTHRNYIDGLAVKRLKRVRQLLEQGYERVITIGADCWLRAPIVVEEFFGVFEPNIVLVPHVVTPPLVNGSYYITGHVNGEIIGFTQNSLPILDWLLSQKLDNNLAAGRFYEQTPLSSLPFIFENVRIYRNPALNYAYFNANERELCRYWPELGYCVRVKDGNWQQLTVAHFSGYTPGSPECASKYTPKLTSGVQRQLYDEYEAAIQEKLAFIRERDKV